MGVPKFFRYISERYPCLSEVIKEYQIPEFDNLYLDMNGIIHNCSHPNDNDPHFRISEKQIFQDIFHHIEILFRMIQPKKLFFMAIDGVAPRAKMNQQRGRRFRSAKEAETLEQKAREKGELLPTEKRFDSNCITPGTPFMYRLHQQLRYFVKLKMTTDKLWKNVKVILSGHETPGEGEHKIMDYIRYMKAKPDYNPNMRHCLYGLDADLIMLGLCTHEPYFSLLREEVKFNKKSNKGGSQIVTPEETKFFLLHLSLMRDYLELEFGQLKEPGLLPFPFSIEKIIDDWVLMGFLIGNDFIPNLPDLHIIDGAMPLMYKIYIEVLPTLEGYINEDGHLNLPRFEKFMTKLASFDYKQFRDKYADIQYLEGKTGKKFTNVFHKEENKEIDPDLAALIKATDDDFDDDDVTEEVLNYADYEEYYYSDEDEEWRKNFFSEFGQHKTDYYHYKLDYAKVTNEVLQDQAECYIRAIQWNLHYYYNGCVSWSWYYPHHYAPYISDIKNFSHLNLKYEMGEPFLPFQQLLAVLPAASKELLPTPYQDLMTLDNSPILEYYPEEFQTDLNGKKQDWEAVVLIPFIDEVKLIEAMERVEHLLTDEERSRNKHGPMLVYTHSNEKLGIAMAPEYFDDITENHADEKPLYRDDIYVHPSKLRKGLCKNVNMSLYHTLFPTLKHLQFKHKIEHAKVKVFQQPSRNDSVIIMLDNAMAPSLKQVAEQILGKTILINYPHLIEVKVLAVSTKELIISSDKNGGPVFEQTSKDVHDRFQLSKKSITDQYFTTLGVDIGKTEILVHAQPVESRKYFFGSYGKVTQQRTYIRSTVTYAYQTSVLNVQQQRESLAFKSIDEIFYPGCQCFTLSNPHYGSEGCVISTVKDENSYIKLSLKVPQEPDLSHLVHMQDAPVHSYLPSYTVASKLSISPLLLSRFTGSIFIINSTEDAGAGKRKNIGLNIKFSRKNEEVVGFTRRDETTKKWFYTEQVVTLIKNYMRQFPEVFHFLKDHSQDDIYLRDEVFPHNGEERVNEIVNWLKEQPHSKAEVRPCGAAVVDEKIVSLIEKFVDASEKAEKRMTLFVRPNKLYIPKPKLDKICADPDTKFELFDRVVNIRDCYTVPLGYRGTIIGVIEGETNYDTIYDVVFDKTFPHGVKIRCSDGRGYRMPAQALINLSHGERLYKNGNPYAKNVNAMRSRTERNSNYAEAARQPYEAPKSHSYFKENSPPVNSNLQVTSPYHAKVSRSNSQQSSVSQSPISSVLSQQTSPYNVQPRERSEQPRINNQTAPTTTQSTQVYEQKVEKPNEMDKPYEMDKKVVFKKEERCIFSNATFSIPTSQNSELLTKGMSFFGYPNLLDVPENKNKLFTGEITASKAKDTSSSDPVEEITSITKNTNLESRALEHKVSKNPMTLSEGKRSEKSENGFSIPSISDLIKQNNITAKKDFPTSSGHFQDRRYSNGSASKEEERKAPDSSFTTKLTNLFNRSNVNETEAENTFKRAISAMVQQSPQLLEKQEELNVEPIELTFEEKHGAPVKQKTESTPTIKTEMRKIISTSETQNLDEEEEVMIIEIKENVDAIEQVERPIDPFQEFLSKMKTNIQPHENNQVLNTQIIPTIDQVENKGEGDANINTVTANTINEFFMEASKRQGPTEQKEITSEFEEASRIVPDKSRPLHTMNVLNESSVDASDMLKKMLNIESLSSSSVASPLEQMDPTILERKQHQLLPQSNEQTEQKPKLPSAFTAVKASTSAMPPADKPIKVVPNNVLLASLKNKPQHSLNPCVPSFIPPQVQKQHIDKIKSFQPHPDHYQGQPLGEFPPQSADVMTSLIRPQPGLVRSVPTSSDLNVYHVPNTNVHPPQPRGTPILGSQSGVYKQPSSYQQQQQQQFHHQQQQQQPPYQHHHQQQQYQYYYNHQQPSQQIYYPQQVTFVQPPQYVRIPGRSSRPIQNNVPQSQAPHQYFALQNQVQMKPHPLQSAVSQHGMAQRYPQTLPGQSSTSQFQPYQATGQSKSGSVFLQDYSSHQGSASAPQLPLVTDAMSRLEERPDSYVGKLLRLTRLHNLGTPDYTFSMDASQMYLASVRICHPHSEIVVHGKPCTKKEDSMEICARRAFNELTQIYPTLSSDASKVEPQQRAFPSTKNALGEASGASGETKADEGEKEKKKPPRIAAKFNVPLKPKN